MDPLIRKKISRTALRNHSKKLEKEIDDLIAAFDRAKDLQTLKTLKSKYDNQILKIQKADEEVQNLLPTEQELTPDIENSLLESDLYFDRVSKIDNCLADDTKPVSVVNSSSSTAEKSQCKLPKLEPPTFDGDILNWVTFWDLFESSVHNKSKLSDVDKFTYLQRALSSTALDCISGLSLTKENYAEAVTLLKQRFGNKQALLNAYVDSFVKLPSIKSTKRISDLRMTYDKLETTVRNLKSLQVESDTYGCFLVPILKEKLPDELTIIMARKFKNNVWPFTEVMDIFKEELEAKEICSTSNLKSPREKQEEEFSTMNLFGGQAGYHDNSGQSGYRDNSGQSGYRDNSGQSGYRNNSGQSGYRDNSGQAGYRDNGGQAGYRNNNSRSDVGGHKSKGNYGCPFCKKNHPPSQCKNVTDVKARVALLRKYGRCFVCLQSGHISRECLAEYVCRKCDEKHHISICGFKKTPPAEKTNNSFSSETKREVLLQTGRGQVYNIDNEKYQAFARFLFDVGSQKTYVTESLAKKLNATIIQKLPLAIGTLGSSERKEACLDVVKMKVRCVDKCMSTDEFIEFEASVIPMLCLPISNQYPKTVSSQYQHLHGLYLSDYTDCQQMKIDVLIGGDFYHTFMSGRCIRGTDRRDPVALESAVGWVLGGPYLKHGSQTSELLATTHALLGASSETRLEKTLSKFWEIESMEGPDENNVMEQFVEDIECDGKRYVTKLPIRPHHDYLPDNFRLSATRFASLRRKLEKDVTLYEGYKDIFREYEKNKIIEKVSVSDTGKPGLVHYLPHRAVVRENSDTTKVRPVFDCSAKSGGPSLNDCLYAGPNLLCKIFDILVRFRTNKVAVISDIKQAFLNVGIHAEHVDLLRFLMFDLDDDNNPEPVIYRFLRALFGAKSSPFLLQGTIYHHCESSVEKGVVSRDFVEDFKENLYVDDSTNGRENVASCFEFYENAKWLMSSAGFVLTKWFTNSIELQKMIDDRESGNLTPSKPDLKSEDDSTYSKFQLGADPRDARVKSVLGITWNLDTDELLFDFSDIAEKGESIKPTKRNVLSVGSTFHDPMGLVSPVVVHAKGIFQLLCKEKVNWDDDVASESLVKSWNEFIQWLKSLNVIRIPRFMFPEPIEGNISLQLHGFCDSSTVAYCAAVYVRRETYRGDVVVNLLAAKTKVAPLKTVTIPRLELLACVLLVNLLAAVTIALKRRYPDLEAYCWSDSEIALCWIKGVHKEWKPWVEHRVKKCRDRIPSSRWFHVPGKLNPADVATRFNEDKDLSPSSCWFSGPEYLLNSPDTWPTSDLKVDTVTEELKSAVSKLTSSNVAIAAESLSNVIDIEKYSNLQILISVIAYSKRFLHNFVARYLRSHEHRSGEITAEEMNEAEMLLIKFEQFHIKQDEKFVMLERSLNLFTDEKGIIRLRGRLENSDLEYATKFPILIRDSHFGELVIRQCHEEAGHFADTTLYKLREKYWIVRGRKVVNRVIRPCTDCRRHQARALAPPPSPALPTYRVTAEFCFQSTGTDFAGPLFVKSIYVSNDMMYKAYISLFTCATSRAVHLELTPDLTGPAYIRALRRFISRRGYPSLLVSDNAKTFKSKEVTSFLRHNRIEKSYIMPASPWWGGFYERLVRSVKLPLKKVLGKSKLTYEEMETSLIEVEGIINSRPLTYTYDDDVTPPLTPNHLLVGRNLGLKSKEKLQSSVIPWVTMGKRAKYIQRVLEMYWNRFKTIYLAELREHHMHMSSRNKTSNENKLLVGDVVVIKEDKITPRSSWRTGRVESLISGRDGKVRGAKLRTISKEGNRTACTRPLQKLIPLEVVRSDNSNERRAKVDPPVIVQTEDIANSSDRNSNNSRPKRKAAKEGEEKRRLCRK